MNITFFSSVSTREKVFNCIPEIKKHNVKFFKLNESDRLLADGFDTDLLFIDAMGTLDKMLIDSMPNLKLIMSEGVGYQGIDVEYATKKGIPVCNNKGVNDTGVSEVALFLMLGCLRNFSKGVDEIYNGRQIEFKKASFGVKKELSECTVGLIGFGDIARKTAEFCNALGAKVIYTNRTRYKNLEEKLNVQYASLDKLLSESDIVSLHVALTPDTINTVDDNFLSKMKNDAFLINTSRGDLVDNNALKNGFLSDGEEYLQSAYKNTLKNISYLESDDKINKRMREMFVLNLNWFMQTLLARKDNMSMASSLEVRVPFCDYRLVEYAYNMPWNIKALDGREKGILRKAFENDLPKEIAWRKKSPYPKTHSVGMPVVRDNPNAVLSSVNVTFGAPIAMPACFVK